MTEEVTVTLKCCNTPQKVTFHKMESPHLPPDEYRKSVVCEACKKLVILHFKKDRSQNQIDQEVIRI